MHHKMRLNLKTDKADATTDRRSDYLHNVLHWTKARSIFLKTYPWHVLLKSGRHENNDQQTARNHVPLVFPNVADSSSATSKNKKSRCDAPSDTQNIPGPARPLGEGPWPKTNTRERSHRRARVVRTFARQQSARTLQCRNNNNKRLLRGAVLMTQDTPVIRSDQIRREPPTKQRTGLRTKGRVTGSNAGQLRPSRVMLSVVKCTAALMLSGGGGPARRPLLASMARPSQRGG